MTTKVSIENDMAVGTRKKATQVVDDAEDGNDDDSRNHQCSW